MFPQQPAFHPSSQNFCSPYDFYSQQQQSEATAKSSNNIGEEQLHLMCSFEEEPSQLAHDYHYHPHHCDSQKHQAQQRPGSATATTAKSRRVPFAPSSSGTTAAADGAAGAARATPTTRASATTMKKQGGGRDNQSIATYLRRFENYSFAQLQKMKLDETDKAAKTRKAEAGKRHSHAQPGRFNHHFGVSRERSPSPHHGMHERRSVSPHEVALSLMEQPLFRKHASEMQRLRNNARTAAFVDDVAPASDLQPATELLRVLLCHLRGQSALPFVTDIRYFSQHVALSLDGHELMTSVCPYFTKILEKHEGKLQRANVGGFSPDSPTRRRLGKEGGGSSGDSEQIRIPQTSLRIYPVIVDSRRVSDTGLQAMLHHMPSVPAECEERDIVAVFMLPSDLERHSTTAAMMTLSSDFTHAHHGFSPNAPDRATTCTMRDGTLCNPWEASFIERTRVAFFKGQDVKSMQQQQQQQQQRGNAASSMNDGDSSSLTIERLLHEATLTAKTCAILKERRKQQQQPSAKRTGSAKKMVGEDPSSDDDLVGVPCYEECHFSVGTSEPKGRATMAASSSLATTSSGSVRHIQPQAVKFQAAALQKFARAFDWGDCFLSFTDLLAIQTMTNWYMLTAMNM